MDLYDVLGLDRTKTPSTKDIKKAYHTKAMQHHPDKGGCSEKFKEITKSYEILSNSEKRRQYDMYGKVDNNTNEPMFNNMFNTSDMFGNMFNRNGYTNKESKTYTMDISLSDSYKGVSKTVNISNVVGCNTCERFSEKCKGCEGTSWNTQMRKIGPGMFQKVSVKCSICIDGYIYKKDCDICKNKRKVHELIKLVVTLPVGTIDGCIKNISNGGMVYKIKINITKHSHFEHNGKDLYSTKQITLMDSIVGFKYEIKLPDDSDVVVNVDRILRNGDVIKIPSRGIPPSGHIFVIISIDYDIVLSEQKKQELRKVFENKSNCLYNSSNINVVECEIIRTKDEKRNQKESQRNEHRNEQTECRQH